MRPRDQTPSSCMRGVPSHVLSQDSRVVTVYSVHCVQCVLSTSATGSNPNALATIPTPSATNRRVASPQDGRTVPKSCIRCEGHALLRKRCRGRIQRLHFCFCYRSTPHTASSSHKPPVGVLVGEPVAPAIELILLRDTLKTELRHRALLIIKDFYSRYVSEQSSSTSIAINIAQTKLSILLPFQFN